MSKPKVQLSPVQLNHEAHRVMIEMIEYLASHWEPSVCMIDEDGVKTINISFLKFPIIVADIFKFRKIIDEFTDIFCDNGYADECEAASHVSDSLELTLNECGFYYTICNNLRATDEAVCYINDQLAAKISEFNRTHKYPAVVEFINRVLVFARQRRIECCDKDEILSIYKTSRIH